MNQPNCLHAKALAEQLLGHEVESACFENGLLRVVRKAIMPRQIIINCTIGPGPELNAERARFLSVLK